MPDVSRYLGAQSHLVQAWFLAFAATGVVLFVVLLQHGSALPSGGSTSQSVLPPPAPLTRTAFEAQFAPVEDPTRWLSRLEAIHAGFSLGLIDNEPSRAVLRTVRTLRTAQVYENRSLIEYDPSRSAEEVAIEILGGKRGSTSLRARREDGALSLVSVSVDGTPLELDSDTAGASVPIEVGDLNLRDHLALVTAVARKAATVVGLDRSLGSIGQVGLRVDLGSEAGDVAFILLDLQSGSVRSVWFFDAEGSLVRTYTGFSAARDSNAPFEGFRVDSTTFGSFTQVTVQQLEVR